jgi:hypothetical protein
VSARLAGLLLLATLTFIVICALLALAATAASNTPPATPQVTNIQLPTE